MTDGAVLEGVKSLTEACVRCIKLSGLAPKQVAAEMGIEAGHLTRMLCSTDSRNFPPDKILDLMRLCGNVLPLEWLAYKTGYALHSLEVADILRAIRDVMSEDGKKPLFKICDHNRIEKA